MRIPILTIILSIICMLSFSSCNNNSTDTKTMDFELTGKWYTVETVTEDGNSPNTEVEYNVYTIQQNGDEFNVSVEGESGSWNGKVDNDKISWNVSRPTETGVSDIVFNGTISDDGNNINGTAAWDWKSNVDSSTSSGNTTIIAEKIRTAEITLGKKWLGTWSSAGGSYTGTFAASLTQDQSMLTGSISIPEIGMTAAKVKGIVSGKTFAFGDIDEIIRFSGNMTEDTTKISGSFYYADYGVSGSWNGRLPGPQDSVVIITGSLNIQTWMYSDIAFGGGKFFVIRDQNIDVFNQSGTLTASFPAPGMHPCGAAFGNGQLICGDGGWGLNKVFEMDPDGKSVLRLPSDDGFTGFCFDGVNLWAINDPAVGTSYIYKLTESGQKLDSIACSGDIQGGLACSADYLWYSARTGSGINVKNHIFKLNHEGAIQGDYTLSTWSPPGLTYDGSKLWYADTEDDEASYLYALNDTGIKIDSIVCSKNVSDIAWDGSHFWLAGSDFTGSPDEAKLYKMTADGTISSSIDTPFNWPCQGLAASADYLWTSHYSIKRILRIPISAVNFFPMPQADIKYLTFDGTNYWAATYETALIKFDRSGEVLNSYTSLIENSFAGIAYDGDGIWFIEKAFNKMVKLAKIDLNGNITASYSASPGIMEPGALCYDGSSLWMTGSRDFINFSFYKIAIGL